MFETGLSPWDIDTGIAKERSKWWQQRLGSISSYLTDQYYSLCFADVLILAGGIAMFGN